MKLNDYINLVEFFKELNKKEQVKMLIQIKDQLFKENLKLSEINFVIADFQAYLKN